MLTLPETTILLVNETYPVECIRSGSALNTSDARFRVKGSEGLDTEKVEPKESTRSDISRPNPQGQSVDTPQKTTAPAVYTRLSSPAPSPIANDVEGENLTSNMSEKTNSDILDTVIEQAKVDSTLVRFPFIN